MNLAHADTTALNGTNRLGFDQRMLPHLDAAYNLARWLVRGEQDACDIVQESFLRAWRFYDHFRGSDAKAWLLAIVRNTAHTFVKRGRRTGMDEVFDEEVHATEVSDSPDAEALRDASASMVRAGLEQLPVELREVIILRELEGLSYKQIAQVVGIPIGTVMSRLSRARQRLLEALAPYAAREELP